MNKDSSRSHSIFTVYVEAMLNNGSIRMGKLHLVDLAGSERQAKTGSSFSDVVYSCLDIFCMNLGAVRYPFTMKIHDDAYEQISLFYASENVS